MQAWLTITLALVLTSAGCSGGDDDVVEAPCGDPQIIVTNDAELASALDTAAPGTCIVLRAGVYHAPIVVRTSGITVAAATGEDVVIEGGEAAVSVRIEAEDVTVIGLEIDGGDYGVVWSGPRGTMSLAEVIAAREEAVRIKCEDQDCLRPGEAILLADVTIRGGDTGLVMFGARVNLERVTVRDHHSEGISGGAGIYALGGTELAMTDCSIVGNAYGLVADGANTRVSIDGGTVSQNDDRGVWAQSLDGAGGTALSIVDTTIEENGIVGVGTLGSAGVRLTGVTVRATIAKPFQVNVMQTVDVGDGVGFFGGSADVIVDASTLADNERAQGVIDDAGAGVTFMGNVTATGGMHQVVVQNSNNMVAVPAQIMSMLAMPLFVQDNPLVVPTPP